MAHKSPKRFGSRSSGRDCIILLRRLTLAAALRAGSALSAHANVFRWANDGDVNSMDPYTRQETFLLAFGSNFY